MGLLLEWDGRANVLVDISLEILELGRRALGVALEDNFVLFFIHTVQAKLFIDVYRQLRDELGELLGKVFVIGTGMNDQVSVEQDVSNSILSEHALDSTAHDLVWVALHELSHGYFL